MDGHEGLSSNPSTHIKKNQACSDAPDKRQENGWGFLDTHLDLDSVRDPV